MLLFIGILNYLFRTFSEQVMFCGVYGVQIRVGREGLGKNRKKREGKCDDNAHGNAEVNEMQMQMHS
jgi:hypothetical protein